MLILAIVACWTLLVTLVTALCIAARRGDETCTTDGEPRATALEQLEQRPVTASVIALPASPREHPAIAVRRTRRERVPRAGSAVG